MKRPRLKLYNTYGTSQYILDDLDCVLDTVSGTIVDHPNEVSLLKQKQLSPDLQEKLGLIMSERAPVLGSDIVDRYAQSLAEKKAISEAAIEALDRETSEFEKYKKEVEQSESENKQALLDKIAALETQLGSKTE